MHLKFNISIIILLIHTISYSQDQDIIASYGLLNRIAPNYAGKIIFKKSNDTLDHYSIQSLNKNIVISGNNANSLAVALNVFLRDICHVSVSWYKNDRITVPEHFPIIKNAITGTARVKERFFLNYCTFGYSMPWWKWEDWERFIDWMALNGINMPLAITGQEKIWLNVWQKFGLAKDEIREYFTGPAYLPWHRMANIDHWDGPLPLSYIENQADLQKKILDRERSFNMKPVLPAFAGHVPKALIDRYPMSKITSLGEWGDFPEQYRSYFLDSFDPLFQKIQDEYLNEQKLIYGTDHIYGIDPFNEVTPPSWEPDYLADVSKNIFNTLKKTDSEARWLQMTWIFFYNQKNWTNDRIKAYLRAVPQDSLILLDYYCDHTEMWRRTESYFGQPYIWCYLGNFGGNTMLEGNMKEVDKRIEQTIAEGGKNLCGLGATLEAFGNNRIMYEFIMSKVWSNTGYNEFSLHYSKAINQHENKKLIEAWQILSSKIYTGVADVGHGDLTNSKPVFEKNYMWTVSQNLTYDNRDLLKVWSLMLESKVNSDVFRNDINAVAKQVLGNYFIRLRDNFTYKFKNGSLQELVEAGNKMLKLLDDIDELLSSNPNTLLGQWIGDARDFGTDQKEKDYYECDARKIITVWGGKGRGLNDYANRSIAGLMKDYYKQRWLLFIKAAIEAKSKGIEPDQKKIIEKVDEISWNWANSTGNYDRFPKGDYLKINRKLYKKYSKLILSN